MPKIYLSTPALAKNYRLLKEKTQGELIPVLKADAYGHGAVFALDALHTDGAEFFAVASAHEARELLYHIKKCEPCFTKTRILVMGMVEDEELPVLLSPHVILAVHSPMYARRLSHAVERLKASLLLPARFSLAVHLKLETGMHRLGLRTEEAIRTVLSLPHLRVEGVYSHLGNAADRTRTEEQHRRFRTLGATLPDGLYTHLSASEGLLRYGDFSLSAVRVGLALYGVAPQDVSLPLFPVMRFCARVLSVFTTKKGDFIGYGSVRAEKKLRLAVIDAGYADGIPQDAARGGMITVEGHDCRFVGATCMDRAYLDIGDAPFREGDEITLFGKKTGDTARFAASLSISPYLLLCQRSARTARIITK